MADIHIVYKDSIRVYIKADHSILYEIKEKFSFYAKGYRFSPNFKYGNWDGKISMLNAKDKSFYTGLIPDLFKWAKEQGYTLSFDNKSNYLPKKPFDDSYIERMKTVGKYTPKDYQEYYVVNALKRNMALILSPTGSGKSFIIYLMIRYMLEQLEEYEKILINVPSISLVEQLFSDFKDYVNDDFNVDLNVERMYGGQSENPNARVIISTWQTTRTKDKEYFEKFAGYICDEAHQASSKELSAIIDNMPDLFYRIGLTGTLDGKQLHEIEMKSRFGTLLQKVTTSELMERGDLAKMEIDARILQYPIDECKYISKKGTPYQTEIDYIIGHELRNRYLIDCAMKCDNNTLMLFNYVEKHGMMLLDDLQAQASKNLKKIFFIYQKVKGSEREAIRKVLDGKPPEWYDVEFENGCIVRVESIESMVLSENEKVNVSKLKKGYMLDDSYYSNLIQRESLYIQKRNAENSRIKKITKQVGCSILLASYGTLAVGVNIKNLHYLIFCHPLKAKIRLLQSIGRVIRASDSKGVVKIIDICDDFSYKTPKNERINHTRKHFIERLKIYEDQKFKYKLSKIEFK